MLKLLSLILIFPLLTLWSCSRSSSHQKEDQKKVFKIMTYNIHHANPPSKPDVIDIDAIAATIQKQDPDLVALQEVDVYTERSGKNLHEAKAIANRLNMYFYFAKALDYQGGFYGNAVLSKLPIQDSMLIALPALADAEAEDRVWAGIKIQVGEKGFWFASTHLDFKTEENNLHQSQTLLNALDRVDIPIITGGDFNVTESSPSIALFDKQFQRTCPGDCPPTIPVSHPNKTIDFLMYRPKDAFSTVSHKVIDEQYASDHLPVAAELTMDK